MADLFTEIRNDLEGHDCDSPDDYQLLFDNIMLELEQLLALRTQNTIASLYEEPKA